MKRLPKYKKGGNSKTDFISEKTAFLISKEGMKPDQAYAVANSMHEQQYKQYGGLQNQPNINNLLQSQTRSPQQDFSVQNQSYLQNAFTPAQPQEGMTTNMKFPKPNINITDTSFNMTGLVENPNYTPNPNFEAEQNRKIIGDEGVYDNKQTSQDKKMLKQYAWDSANGVWDNNPQNQNYKYQFFDPYKGIDIPTAAYTLGRGIETGNTLETVGSGLKLLTGLGRNAFAGAGNARRNNFILKDAQEKYRDSLTPDTQSFQMGGEMMPPPQEQSQQIDPNQIAQALQQGADPNEVLQMLMQAGMSQEEATQLISQIIQQLQGQQQSTEEAVMQDGGKKYKALTGEYTIEKDRIEEEDVVAELESREFLKTPTQEITQIDGEAHESGGVKLTEEQIPDGSEVISDHLKLTKDQVKSFSEKYDLKLSTKDTYADILHKWNKKSGLDENVKEQEDLIKQIEKQVKLLEEKPEAETTINLNIDLLQKELAELEQEKQPLEEERKSVFNEVFKAQESQKPKEEKEDDKMQDGGMFNGDMVISYAKKHGISPDRAMELVNMYKNGGYKKYQDAGKVKNPFIQNSTTLTDFSNQPSILERLPYTPRETNPNEIWKGENYLNTWKPLVEQSMNNPESAKKIDDWLMANKGTFSPNVQKQLENLTGQARIDRIKALATDEKPGLFHNAVLQAIKETVPVEQPKAEVPQNTEDNTFDKTTFDRGNSTQTRMGIMALPDQYAPLPDALQGNLKLEYRPNLVDKQNVTAEPIIAEIRRQEQSAMQSIQNLPDAQRGAAIAQLQANTQEQINKVMNQVQGQNLQSDVTVANANAGILNNAQDINNRYTLDFEGKILKADALTRNDVRNWMNHNQAVNLANSNAINKLNYYNQLSEYNQITPNGIEMTSSPEIRYSNLSNAQIEAEAKRIENERKKREKEALKKKNGGRIKRKL